MRDALIDHPLFVVLSVDQDGLLVEANSGAESYFARSARQITGRPLAEVLYHDHRLVQLLAAGVPQTVFDAKLGTSLQNIDRFDIHILAPDTDGHRVIFLHPRPQRGGHDLTDAVGGAARLASGVAALLAHEIRNPLAAIKGAAQLLEDSVEGEDRNLLDLIGEEAARIGRLAADFEEMAGSTPPHIEKVNVHEILDQAVRAAKAGFASGVDIVELYDPSLPEIPADHDRMQRAFTNLIKNANDAIEVHGQAVGEIRITTRFAAGFRRDERDLPIEVKIEDTGGGIDESLIRDIFKPFITSKNNGTGLGLSVVARTIDELGGAIDVTNTGRGARFRMHLPKWSERWTAP